MAGDIQRGSSSVTGRQKHDAAAAFRLGSTQWLQKVATTIKVKLVEDHSPRCVTRRDQKQARSRYTGADPRNGISVFDAPWFFDIDKSQVMWLDARGGRRSKKYKWLRFECGDPACNASGIVRIDSVAAIIEQAIILAGGKSNGR
jgi:hypothetical protein